MFRPFDKFRLLIESLNMESKKKSKLVWVAALLGSAFLGSASTAIGLSASYRENLASCTQACSEQDAVIQSQDKTIQSQDKTIQKQSKLLEEATNTLKRQQLVISSQNQGDQALKVLQDRVRSIAENVALYQQVVTLCSDTPACKDRMAKLPLPSSDKKQPVK